MSRKPAHGQPSSQGSSAVIAVRVTPRAGRDELTAVNGTLRVKLRAAPVEGAANAALIALLAGRLDIPKSAVQITRGATSRNKLVTVAGLTADDIWRRLSKSPPPR